MEKLVKKSFDQQKTQKIFTESVTVVKNLGETSGRQTPRTKEDKNLYDLGSIESSWKSADGSLAIYSWTLNILDDGVKMLDFSRIEIYYKEKPVFIASASHNSERFRAGVSVYEQGVEWERILEKAYSTIKKKSHSTA